MRYHINGTKTFERWNEMIFKKRAKTQDKLIDDIRKLNQQLERAHASFQQETDSDLISSYIYEINALKARYSYLFKLAKRMLADGSFEALPSFEIKEYDIKPFVNDATLPEREKPFSKICLTPRFRRNLFLR